MHGAFEGCPIPVSRNWEAYTYYREPPTNQAASRKAYARESTSFLQRSRAGLMVPTQLTNELIGEQLSARASQEEDEIRMQGNCLLFPPLPTVNRRRSKRQLMVHVGGPLMSELRLSWLCHGPQPSGEEEEVEEGSRQQREGWWVSGCRSVRCDTGRLRQLECLPGVDELSVAEGGAGECWAMARAGYQALVLAVSQLPHHAHDSGDGQDDDEHEGPVPFVVRFRQKLKFTSRLTSVAGWSSQRSALLTESLDVYEWRAAVGAARCDVDLSAFKPPPQQPGSFNPQVVWGGHPTSLWVSAGWQLLHVDLRARTPAQRLAGAHGVPLGDGPALPTGGDVLGACGLEGVGAMCRHPSRENLMFVSARSCLLALDVRCLRGPLDVLPQSETSSLLQTARLGEGAEAAVVSAGQTSARLHLHLPKDEAGAERKRVLSSWQSDTLWLAEGAGAGGQGGALPLLPAYRTLTCYHPDLTTTRPQPVWLAGLGLASTSPGSVGAVASMTSLGDVYLQRLASSSEPRPPQPSPAAQLLPCGLSSHVAGQGAQAEEAALLPSHAKPQPREPSSLRQHREVALPADLQALLRTTTTAQQPSRPASSSSSSSTSMPAAARRALLSFLSDEPRTLADLHHHLQQRKAGRQGAATTTTMGVGEVQAWLEQEDGVRSAVCELRVSGVRRQSAVHVRVAAESGPGVEESKRSQDTPPEAGTCTCNPSRSRRAGQHRSRSRPCASPACLVPHALVYWVVQEEDEAGEEEEGRGLRVRRADGGAGQQAGAVSMVSGLDRDGIEWLRQRWPPNSPKSGH